ncbi:IS110 family transposase [Micromonospora globbae]|uniref:IS110 family transposase n=1 Tax=Micromonospora globbae TaxID=1894969 RepID=UPI0037B116C5
MRPDRVIADRAYASRANRAHLCRPGIKASTPSKVDQDAREVILGVDMHEDVHVAAAVNIHGVLLDSRGFPTTVEGYQAMLNWAIALGPIRRAGAEGTHSYGAALTRHLLTAGIGVIEVNQPDKAHRRRRGKTVPIDAEAAGRAVLPAEPPPSPRQAMATSSGYGCSSSPKPRPPNRERRAINQLKAVLVGADPALRDSMTGLSNPKLIRRCANLDPGQPDTPAPWDTGLISVRDRKMT